MIHRLRTNDSLLQRDDSFFKQNFCDPWIFQPEDLGILNIFKSEDFQLQSLPINKLVELTTFQDVHILRKSVSWHNHISTRYFHKSSATQGAKHLLCQLCAVVGGFKWLQHMGHMGSLWHSDQVWDHLSPANITNSWIVRLMSSLFTILIVRGSWPMAHRQERSAASPSRGPSPSPPTQQPLPKNGKYPPYPISHNN